MTRTLSIAAAALLLATSCRTSSSRWIGAPPSAPQHAPVAVNADTVGYAVAAPAKTWETSIAVSPANPNVAVVAGMFQNAPGNAVVRTYRTDDAGATWHPSAAPPLVTAKTTYNGQGDPVVVFDRNGVAYLVTLMRASVSGRTGIAVWRSADGGRTWSEARPVVERQGNYFDDKEWIGVDTTGGPYDGTLYVAWLRSGASFQPPFELMFSRSSDGGLTWSPETAIGLGGGPQFAIGPAGEIHITYGEGLNMKVVTSRDGGVSFTDRATINQIAGPNGALPHVQFFLFPFASSAADTSWGPHRGNVYTTWAGSADGYPNGGNALPGTTWFSRSTDSGRTWSAPMQVSNPASGRDAMFPSLACDPVTGHVVVAWLDRTDDPENRLARIYAARSIDGGATFSAPRAFTSPVNLSGVPFVGHYNGTGGYGGVWLTAFSDAAGTLGVARLTWEALPPPPSGPRRRSVRH
jgi:hypothetical protein